MNEEVRVVVDFYQERVRDKLIPLPEMAIPPAIYDVGDGKPGAESKHGDFKLERPEDKHGPGGGGAPELKTGVAPVLDFSGLERKSQPPPSAALSAPVESKFGSSPPLASPGAPIGGAGSHGAPAEDDDPFARLASRGAATAPLASSPLSPGAVPLGHAAPAQTVFVPIAASTPAAV
jgi:hypothetical protein